MVINVLNIGLYYFAESYVQPLYPRYNVNVAPLFSIIQL